MSVMIIDDDPDDVLLFKEVVRMINPQLQCMVFTDGSDALQYLRDNAMPMLLFLDINMPKTTGIEVLKALKSDQRLKDINVVVFSTAISPVQAEHFKRLGTPYAEKGYSLLEWKKTMKLHLDRVEHHVS